MRTVQLQQAFNPSKRLSSTIIIIFLLSSPLINYKIVLHTIIESRHTDTCTLFKKHNNNPPTNNQHLMEEDPKFTQLYRKSHLLKKYKDLEVPMVEKIPRLKHEAFTTVFLMTGWHFATYFVDTIKVRIQAKNKVEDVSHFTRNKVENVSLVKGIMRGYLSVVIGSTVHLTAGKQFGLYPAAVIQGVLKSWVDIGKISMQMGNQKNQLPLLKRAYIHGTPVAIVRDIIYRAVMTQSISQVGKLRSRQTRFRNQVSERTDLIACGILATLLSQPFDVIFTKLASQRYPKYSSSWDVVRTVSKEEGVAKLLISGLWPRIMLCVSSAYLMAACYLPVRNIALEAF